MSHAHHPPEDSATAQVGELVPDKPLERRTIAWLIAILAVGFGLRLTYLLMVTSNPGFTWIDPDSYLREARNLAGHGEGWRWSFEAVRHSVEGRDYALPPLYPVFLSLFALFPNFPFTAQVGQIVLATLANGLTFVLGRQIHSTRTGLIAAALYALWLPNIIAVWSTMQEALYIPVVLLAFVLLGRAINGSGGLLAMVLAGATFGLAALTRSMPMYFVLPAGLLYVAVARDRSRATGQAAALLVGFLLVSVPYSIGLSLHLNQWTFIENHGGLRIVAKYGELEGHEPPGLLGTATVLARAFAASPSELMVQWIHGARSMFHVNGGRLLQIYLAAESYAGAVAWKVLAHLGVDLMLVLSVVLSPLGLIFAKRWRIATVFALWIALNTSLTSLSGFGGARLRAPFEPHVMVLASVVLAGQHQRRRAAWLALSGGLAALMAVAVLPQLPTSLGARGDYGVQWSRLSRPKTTMMRGRAGFNLIPRNGDLQFEFRLAESAGEPVPTNLTIRANAQLLDEVLLHESRRTYRYEWPRLEMVYVELAATNSKTGMSESLLVSLPR